MHADAVGRVRVTPWAGIGTDAERIDGRHIAQVEPSRTANAFADRMVAAVRKEDHALFGAQYTRPTTVEVTETAMTRIRWCPLARSSEGTAGTLAVASSDLPVRQEDKPDAIALEVSLRQPDAPMVGARARVAPNVSSLKSCSSGPRPTPPAEPSPRRALPRGARRARRRLLHPCGVERSSPATLVAP
jgi:hypothetical protein